jgi:type I restriction enzyme R subunit
MWLTGFDAPSLHTMYVDKPMRGHGLMQAIARVNRVFRDKPGGLVVDYLGLAEQLKDALATYTAAGGQGRTAIDQEEAVKVVLEKVEVCRAIFHGFDYSTFLSGTPADRLRLLPGAQQHIFALDDGRDRLVKAVTELVRAFALAVPHPKAMGVRDEVAFFAAVKAAVVKSTATGGVKTDAEMDQAIQQIVSRAITTEGVVDIFKAAGLKNPDIGILSDEFLAEVKGLPQKNLAVELLRKLLNDELRVRRKKNLVQSEAFSEKLEKTIVRYRNRAIEAAQVIEELIGLAREMREARRRGEDLKLNDDEAAFYEALADNDSAKGLGDKTLAAIARDLTQAIHESVTIDWTVRENVRAQMRVKVRRLLKKYKYPPDETERAIETVIRQAELLAADWAAA